jgi:trigger factor
LPKWKGLKLDRPTHEFSDRDIDGHLETQISRKGRLVPFDGAAEAADYVVVNITFSKGPDLISRADEQTIRIRRHLSFPDGRIDHIDKLLIGTKAGDTRQTQIAVSHDAPRDDLHGVKLDVNIEVLEVKRLELPKLDDDLLERLGGHKTEEELRAAVKRELELRLAYHQQQSIRAQIADLLTASAELDLPPEMVRRQSKRELDRASLELRSSGFAEDEIQARENELRRNSVATTRKALKEHFIFERIADEESLDASEADYDAEIERIAAQSQEPPRRIRARIEKRGMMDALRNQIVERKVVELIASHATFRDVPFEPETNDIEAIEHYVCGQTDVSIPVAKHAGEAKELPHAAERG